jgi:prepilin-type N-terminal cleavage/methylation domain-containing protein
VGNPSSFCILRSSFCVLPRRRWRRGYTLVELFLTIAVLAIILGLMVDLANRVRRTSADKLTRQLLQQLNALMDNYLEHSNGQLPPVTPFLETMPIPDEPALQIAAAQNNADFVRYLRTQSDLSMPTKSITDKQDVFAGLPLNLYDEVTLHDPWGSPIVFMPRQHPLIGMAPGDKFFFFSAGPDRRFLSRQDNLYSYEENGP